MTNLPSNLVVLLCGNRGAGKDTLFHLLNTLDNRLYRSAFADSLKSDLRSICFPQFKIDPLTATGTDKEFIRPLLIAFGCMWREKDIDHWAAKVAGDIQQQRAINPQPMIHVTTDGRFENEVVLFRERFGGDCRVIWVERAGGPEPTQEECKHADKVRGMADHTILWGGNSEESRLETARGLVKWLENSLK